MESKKNVGLTAHGRIDRFVGSNYSDELQDRFVLVIIPDLNFEGKEICFSPSVQEELVGVMKDQWRSELSEITVNESMIAFTRKYLAIRSGDNKEKEYVEKYRLYNMNGLWVGTFQGELGNRDRGVIWLCLNMVCEGDSDATIEALIMQADIQKTS